MSVNYLHAFLTEEIDYRIENDYGFKVDENIIEAIRDKLIEDNKFLDYDVIDNTIEQCLKENKPEEMLELELNEIPFEILYDNKAKQKPIKELPGFENFYPAIQGCSATAHITPDDVLRKVYQDYAQSCRQNNPDIWVDMLKNRAACLENQGVICMVVDDVRQQNELDYCNESTYVYRIHEYDGYVNPAGSEHSVESGFPEEMP